MPSKYTELMTDQQSILEVANLKIVYGDFVAVHDVSFSVRSGEIFGLLGPNGAGKTSTLSAIEGLVKPDRGSVHVAGFNIATQPLEAKANFGVQLQASSFQKDLDIVDIIKLYAGLYGLQMDDEAIYKVIVEMNLESSAQKKTGELSGGQQQRAALATATLHNPPLVLLDEPTTGLDPQSRRALWERIERMREQGRSIVVTTHSMEEAYAICDRVAIIDHGRIIATGNPQGLIDQYRDDPNVRAASRKGVVTLEDVFIGLTGKEVRE